MNPMDLKQHIRHVPDFPKPGILFYDITTLLRDPGGLKATIDQLSAPYVGQGIDAVIGIESRGFILGSAVADRIGAGFIPIRKPGKLPAKRMREAYALEYGTDALEIHEDAVQTGQRVLIVDDVLATGGTAAAAARLVRQLGGELQGLAFLIELLFLERESETARGEGLLRRAVLDPTELELKLRGFQWLAQESVNPSPCTADSSRRAPVSHIYSPHRWPLLPARASASTQSRRRSAKAGWAKCFGRATRRSTATSRSRSCPTRSPMTPIGSLAFNAKRRRSPP